MAKLEENTEWIFEEKVTEDFRQTGIFTVAKIMLVSYGDSNSVYMFRNFKCNNQNLIQKITLQKNGVDVLKLNQNVEKLLISIRQKYLINDEAALPLEYMDVSLIENINEPLWAKVVYAAKLQYTSLSRNPGIYLTWKASLSS